MTSKKLPKELGAYRAEQVKLDHKTSTETAVNDDMAADNALTASLSDEILGRLKAAEDQAVQLAKDLDKYRERLSREKEDAEEAARFETIKAFLPVFDHFELALAAAEDSGNLQAILDGLSLIQAEFSRTLEKLGVEPIQAVGQPFDHNLHEAVAKETSSRAPEGVVIKQWKTGYIRNGKLLRPAAVVVSGGQ